MKIDRRSFLGLGLGAAAGVAASPVTWKLTDDSSIWTQNWPWTPVPRDGEVSFDDTVCTLCSGNCGISIRKIDGRAVKIEGKKGYPVNDGGICLHGISGLQYLYDPSRVRFPMVKSGDNWKQASWEEAIALVATKIKELRKNGMADSLACVTGSDQGSIAGLYKRLLMAVGSQNFYTTDTMDKSWEMLIAKMHGVSAAAGFDIANSDYVLSFGTGFIEGWGSPVNNFLANSSRKERQAKFVQVEYRLSNTAAAADVWLPAKPGTETDLALGICSAMITANLYNSEFAQKAGKDFDAFAKLVNEKYAPELVSRTTGIDVSKIKNIAVEFAKAKAPLAIAGRGKGDSAGSLMEFAAVHAINCLAGNINKVGGFWTLEKQPALTWPSLEMDDAATKGYAKPPVGAMVANVSGSSGAGTSGAGISGAGIFSAVVSSVSGQTTNSVSRLFEVVNISEKSPVELLMVYNANPCFTLHNAKAVKDAVNKIPFVVSFSSYMDETSQLADVILPSHMFLEMSQDIYSGAGIAQKVTAISKSVVTPVFDTKNPGDAIIEIAKAMEGSIASSFPWKNYDACLESVTGKLWASLSEEGYVASELTPPATSVAADFSVFANFSGIPAIEGEEKSYPLTLVSVDTIRLASGVFASSPFAVKTVEDTVLLKNDTLIEINPETADKVGVCHGDYAVISTPVGEAKVRVNVFDGIMPGVVAMPEGLGHSLGAAGEVVTKDGAGMARIVGATSIITTTGGVSSKTGALENRYIGGKGINVNDLIGPVTDPVSGLDVAWGIRARISRV
ncbi:MAG: molybdopterin-dependent oxidoreductase [Desulfamplus sp.]|nr:molybdopterin-dependent oxidoreductase [Desulfamplus sp.]